MTTDTCETCRFWARDPFGRALGGPHTDGSVSDCRRNAPIAVKADRYPLANAVWPQTHKLDFCGEHQPKEAPHD